MNPSAPRVVRRALTAGHGRTACIIAVGEWGGHKCIFKNRDRNYIPEIRIYHELQDGTEVLYLKDELTGWCEGMNEYGVGIVNSALAVSLDEKEKDVAKGKPGNNATLRDGERILKGLVQRDLQSAMEATQNHKGGLRGHTFIVSPDASYSMEATWRGHDYHVRKLPTGRKHVRTNHGQFHQDAGYTEGDGENYLSSLARRDQAMKLLRKVEEPHEIAPAVFGKRRPDREDPLNMIKLTEGMRTTTQMVMDLTDLVTYLYLIPDQVVYLGYEKDLPKDYDPRITLKVFEYTDLDEGGEFEVKSRKKSAGGMLPLMDPLFSLREAAKQLVLLEDHLSHPQKRCMDCISKHLLAAEAFSEEAVSLDKTGEFYELLVPIPSRIRSIWRSMREKPANWIKLAQTVRGIRKQLVSQTSAVKVAAKYKSKKEINKADGSGKTTVYEYGPRQKAQADRDKAERVEKLRGDLSKLRSKYRGALSAKDEKTRLTALAVALIDETYERVGNEKSADEGHFGVTGWRKKHVSFKGGKATLKYTGKSGVKHKKEVSHPGVVKALKVALKDKEAEDRVFCAGEDCTVGAEEVNAYLKDFGITAKDIRGLHANEEMRTRLKEVRKEGLELPRDRKERDKILKGEFKKALEGAAKAVGHTPAILRSSYLVPELETSYLHDGTVLKKLTGKKASGIGVHTATKTRAEKEDEATEALIKPSPKKKPPRTDLQNRRVKEDEAEDPDKKQDKKDRSQNYKDASSYRVALRYFLAKEERVKVILKDTGNVTTVTKKTLDENPTKYKIPDDGPKDTAKSKALGEVRKPLFDEFQGRGLDDKVIQKTLETIKDPENEEDIVAARELLVEATEKAKAEAEEKKNKWRESVVQGVVVNQPDNASMEGLATALSEMTDEQLEAFEKGWVETREKLDSVGPKDVSQFKGDVEKIRDLLTAGSDLDPKKLSQMAAKLDYFERVVDNPAHDADDPLPESGPVLIGAGLTGAKAKANTRAAKSVKKYLGIDSQDRERHRKKLDSEISGLEEGDPRRLGLEGVRKGIDMVNIIEDGEKAKGTGQALSRLAKAAAEVGTLDSLMDLEEFGGTEVLSGDAQTAVRKTYETIPDDKLESLLPDDHPAKYMVELLTDPKLGRNLSEGDRKKVRQMVQDMMVAEVAFLDPSVSGEIGPEATVAEHGERAKAERSRALPKKKLEPTKLEQARDWVDELLKNLTIRATSAIKKRKKQRAQMARTEIPKSKDRREDGPIQFYSKNLQGETRGFASEDAAKTFASGTGPAKTAHPLGWDFEPWPIL